MAPRNKKSVRNAKELLAQYGRNGDTLIAHISKEEARLLDAWQGGTSINPVTGLPEYFKWKKVLKGVARAAGAAAGAYFGGPAGAAVGGALATKLTGGSWKNALTNGLISGVGAYGLQQTGLGDSMGIASLGKGADLLGRAAPAAASAASSGGGAGLGSLSKYLPVAALGAAALASKPKNALSTTANAPIADMPPIQYEPINRKYSGYGGNYDTYGQDSGQYQFYDEVNPQPVQMRYGGAVRGFKYGGDTREGGVTGGDRGRAGMGGDRDKGRSRSKESLAAEGSNKLSQSMSRDTDIGRALSDTGAGDATRYGVGALATAGSAGQRSAMRGQAQDINEGDGMLGLGGLMGLRERFDLSSVAATKAPDVRASWGLDPVQPVATLAGLATGIPFGSMYGIGKYAVNQLTGARPPEVNLGPDVFGSNPTYGSDTWSDSFSGSGETGKPVNGQKDGDRDPATGQAVISALSNAFGSQPTSVAQAANTPTVPAPVVNTDPVPQSPQGRNYIPASGYETYGQGPMHQFFDNVNPVLAAATGGGIRGPGHGQEDKIPAMLSDGEFVVDAATVSALGGGSTDAGVKKLEQLRAAIRKNAGYKNTKKIPPAPMGIGAMMKQVA